MANIGRAHRFTRQYNEAVRLYRADLLGEASTLAVDISNELGPSPTSARERRLLGLARELSAFIYRDRGMTQEALEAFMAAEAALSGDPANKELLERVRFQIAALTGDLRFTEAAAAYSEETAGETLDAERANYTVTREIRRNIRQITDWRMRLGYLREQIQESTQELEALSASRGRYQQADAVDAEDVLSGIPEILLVTPRQPRAGPGRGGGQDLIG